MITNAAVRNEFIQVGKYSISFDGAQVTVLDRDGDELTFVSTVCGYMLPAETVRELKTIR